MFDRRHKIVILNCLLAVVYLVWSGEIGAGWLSIGTGPVSVLIIEETEDRAKLTAGQLDTINSNAPAGLRAYLKTHGEQDAGGSFRLVDKDDSLSQDAAKWQGAFDAAKGQPTPWLIVARGGRVLLSEALPKSEDETLRAVKRYGGQ